MPLLGPDDPVPVRPQRVLVAGTSGAGKTTFARRISRALDVPHVEIDALFHGPSWTARATFEQDVDHFSAATRWVTEWQYDAVRGMLAARGELLVWLDLPRRVVMWQVIRRTLGRRRNGEVLWNNNIEPPLHTILTNPDHIIRWAWTSHNQNAQRIAGLQRDHPHLALVRLRTHRESERWLASLDQGRPNTVE